METNIQLSDLWLEVREERCSIFLRSYLKGRHDSALHDTASALLKELQLAENRGDFQEILGKKHQHDLSVVFVSESRTVLKSDSIRSAPIFYKTSSQGTEISDQIPMMNDHHLDDLSCAELVMTNYVSGHFTIYEDLFGIQAAEIIVFGNSGEIHRSRYFKYDLNMYKPEQSKQDVLQSTAELEQLFRTIFKELIQSVPKGANILVPLSGGHDSRLVVNYLHKMGAKNVICFTYGVKGNRESAVSKRVAGLLDYEWHFIEYTEEKWYKLHSNGDFNRYLEFACNGVSNPHIQDFLAVSEMKTKGIAKPGDVFVPGHGLDLLCNNFNATLYSDPTVKAALDKFYWMAEASQVNEIKIRRRLQRIFEKSNLNKDAFLEYLMWQERQAKFTINSFRAYEYFGFEARAPYWDSRLVDFWLRVPQQLKYDREILMTMEQDELLVDQLKPIPFTKVRFIDGKPAKKKKVIQIPNFIKVLFLRISRRKQVQGEGLNLIYEKNGRSVKEVIGPLELWPTEILKIFKQYLYRYPFQINHHYLTRLVTMKMLLENNERFCRTNNQNSSICKHFEMISSYEDVK